MSLIKTKTSRVFTLVELANNDFTKEGFNDELLTELKSLLQKSEQFSGEITSISPPTKINDHTFKLNVMYNIWCPIREAEGDRVVICEIHHDGKIINGFY